MKPTTKRSRRYGRDLLEHMQETEFISVYGDELWVEQVYQNRRLLLVWLNWNFRL